MKSGLGRGGGLLLLLITEFLDLNTTDWSPDKPQFELKSNLSGEC